MTLLSFLAGLEYLSGYKAGLAQHLYVKKIAYLARYYQGNALILQCVSVLILLIAAVTVYHRWGRIIRFGLSKFCILLAALLMFYFSPFTRELNIYAHGLITLQLCLLLEVSGFMGNLLPWKFSSKQL